jgi:hypothetical protein
VLIQNIDSSLVERNVSEESVGDVNFESIRDLEIGIISPQLILQNSKVVKTN